MSFSKILLIGAGQLGSRYLQGLVKIEKELIIDVVDPSQESIKRAQLRIKEISTELIHKYKYMSRITQIRNFYDLAIISTTADIRSEIITKLNHISEIKFWIIEKNLAQSPSQINSILKVLKDPKKAWINTSFRAMNWHKEIKKELIYKIKKPINMKVYGGNWGLSCNAIHYIDLMAWWTNASVKKIDTNGIKKWIDSKRKGFKEIIGEIIIEYTDNSILLISSNEKGALLPQINVMTEGNLININEQTGVASSSNGKIIKGGLSHQSDLTAIILKQIIETNDCDLPSFNNSYKNHMIFIKSLLLNWNKLKKRDDKVIKIT